MSNSNQRKSLKERMALKAKKISQGENISEYTPNDYDKEQFELFVNNLDNMIEILKLENFAIHSGDLDTVNKLHEDKKDGLRQLEIKTPIIEEYMKFKNDPGVKEKIGFLKELIDNNGILLERMSFAARNITYEINKIQNKHSLDGLYEKSGRKIEENFTINKKLDQNL
jgi:hypothetical protein